MSELKKVRLSAIDPNPFRGLDSYPWIEDKVAALQRSIEEVGFWEGVIVRKVGNRYQLAFGHHRIEAAKRSGMVSVPVIIRDLDDKQMLQFMGRENGEDYTTQFLVMLNAWEGAVDFSLVKNKTQPVEIARLLGWVRTNGAMNAVAEACSAAHSLIAGGYVARGDLEGLDTMQANHILSRAATRMKQLDKAGERTQRPKKEIEAAKKQVAKGAKNVAKKAKAGEVATKDLRGEVDAEAHKAAARSKVKQTPLFAVFGKALADGIEKMLATDAAADKLQNIVESLEHLTMEEDAATVRRVDFQLGELANRAGAWQKKLILSKVVKGRFPALEGGKS